MFLTNLLILTYYFLHNSPYNPTIFNETNTSQQHFIITHPPQTVTYISLFSLNF